MKTTLATLDIPTHFVLFADFILEATAFHILVESLVRGDYIITHITIYLCLKALYIKSFCLDELLSHIHFLYDSNNRIGNIFFRRKGNGNLLVLLHSYLHLHFVINSKTEEKILEFMHIKATTDNFILVSYLKISVF